MPQTCTLTLKHGKMVHFLIRKWYTFKLGSSGKWSDRFFKVALTKTIKTPKSIFREPSSLHCLP